MCTGSNTTVASFGVASTRDDAHAPPGRVRRACGAGNERPTCRRRRPARRRHQEVRHRRSAPSSPQPVRGAECRVDAERPRDLRWIGRTQLDRFGGHRHPRGCGSAAPRWRGRFAGRHDHGASDDRTGGAGASARRASSVHSERGPIVDEVHAPGPSRPAGSQSGGRTRIWFRTGKDRGTRPAAIWSAVTRFVAEPTSPRRTTRLPPTSTVRSSVDASRDRSERHERRTCSRIPTSVTARSDVLTAPVSRGVPSGRQGTTSRPRLQPRSHS